MATIQQHWSVTWCQKTLGTTPANIVTHLRLPLFAAGLLLGFYGWFGKQSGYTDIGLGLLITSALTDLVDGPLSRWLKCSSRYGGALDSTHDKIFFGVVVAACLVPIARADLLHAIVLLGLFSVSLWRDLMVTLYRVMAASQNVSCQAQWYGKLRTLLYMIFCCVLYTVAFEGSLLGDAKVYPELKRLACFALEAIIGVLTIVSWLSYRRLYLPAIRQAMIS